MILQGFGLQTDDTIGELLELPLKYIDNEICFKEFEKEKDGYIRPKSSPRARISSTLYDGITDQIICTKITCEAGDLCQKGQTKERDACLERKAKCVRIKVVELFCNL